jgi:hypothetical protein
MMQVDNLVKGLQDEIICGLRIPEIFARGGITSNKAVGDVEMQAFDRKCRALIYVITMECEDHLFPKITNRSSDIKMVWNEFSAEGELIRAQRLKFMIDSGIPLKVAIKMIGWGTWVDDIEKERKVEEVKQQDLMKQQNDMAIQQKTSVMATKAKTQTSSSVSNKTKAK